MSTTALLNSVTRLVVAVLLGGALVLAAAIHAPARYELYAMTPRATLVFDRWTGEAEQREPLPLFAEKRTEAF